MERKFYPSTGIWNQMTQMDTVVCGSCFFESEILHTLYSFLLPKQIPMRVDGEQDREHCTFVLLWQDILVAGNA